MDKREIRKIFEAEFKGRNFMTPHIYKYGESGPFIYEISYGNDFHHREMYGVTALYLDSAGNVHKVTDLDINRCFQYDEFRENTKIEALDYAENLRDTKIPASFIKGLYNEANTND